MADDDGIRVSPQGDKKNKRKSEKKIDFLQDDPKDMTFGRRFALYMMERYPWYNPKLVAPKDGIVYTKGTKEESYDSDEKQKQAGPSGDVPVDGHFRSNEIGHPVAVTPTDDDANLDEAWAHFEHVTLARYVVRNKEEEEQKTCISRFIEKLMSCCKTSPPLDCAEPGENKYYTKLYHPFFTPHSQLGDFGIGCGIYFSTLRAFCILTFVCGLINIPVMSYYASSDYGAHRGDLDHIQNQASAICVDYEWVLCDDCFVSPSFPGDRVRFYNETNSTTGQEETLMAFGRKNGCDAATIENGMINFATMIIISIGIVVINIVMSRAEVAFDIDEQTAQDYSILIDNPPSDAYTPEEWKQYFETNFRDVHVTCCTIGLDNDLLLRDLIERRETMKKLEMMVDPGTSLDMLTLAGISAHVQRDRGAIANLLKSVSPGVPELVDKVAALNVKIKGLVQLDYPVTNVFVTFETEAAQRQVLKALTVGRFQAVRNDKKAVKNEAHLFRNEHVLHVSEPDEPNTIRWKNLNANIPARIKIQCFTALATFIGVICIALITGAVNEREAGWAAIIISVTNSLFPIVGNILVNLEEHPSESDRQASLYWKIAFFRWVNTAVVFTMITPFNTTIDEMNGVIVRVRGLFFAEITISTAMQLLDVAGHLNRHFTAPRGKTQDKMDLAMDGGKFDLAERYTNMTKFLFLALWYSSIYPTGLFMCSLSMFINYYVDRFSLMRTWKKPLNLGNEISMLNKRYFFPLCVFGMAFASSYFWSGFPYDNLCDFGTIGERNDYTSEYLTMGPYGNGTIPVIPPHGTGYVAEANFSFQVTNETVVWEHCFQDFLRTRGRAAFPFVPQNQKENNHWMSEEQTVVTNIYGWTTLVVMIIIIFLFVYYIGQNIIAFFVGSYEESGADQGIDFSNVESISTYIPQVNSTVYPYPLLASNIDDIDDELLEWNDDDRPHAFYDLTLDAKMLTHGLDDDVTKTTRGNAVFCEVKHWPPPKNKRSSKNKPDII